MYDLIGDIHGHADELEALLRLMGYTLRDNAYYHPERKVVFVGDYIDRGPHIRRTLDVVRRMADAGHAIALMGNHEYNALCFHYQEREGGHLRKHLIKNIIQHYQTLVQFQNQQEAYEDYLEWFTTLPLYLETESFRAVHACWDSGHIHRLRDRLHNDRLTDELIYASAEKGTSLYEAIDETLKGKELDMPAGLSFFDKDGNRQSRFRIKWWEDPATATYRELSIVKLADLPDEPVDTSSRPHWVYYSETEKPVFFGHYWLRGEPFLYRHNVCCLDFSVAKGGRLVAYRHHGESVLTPHNLIWA